MCGFAGQVDRKAGRMFERFGYKFKEN